MSLNWTHVKINADFIDDVRAFADAHKISQGNLLLGLFTSMKDILGMQDPENLGFQKKYFEVLSYHLEQMETIGQDEEQEKKVQAARAQMDALKKRLAQPTR
jgi:hypothetical protein